MVSRPPTHKLKIKEGRGFIAENDQGSKKKSEEAYSINAVIKGTARKSSIPLLASRAREYSCGAGH